MLEKIGISVVFLVSRKLQSGVLDELNKNSAKTVNLDIDICPAPGLAMDQNLVIAKATASNVRGQLLSRSGGCEIRQVACRDRSSSRETGRDQPCEASGKDLRRLLPRTIR